MKKAFIIIAAAMSISCSTQKKFEYMPDYNSKILQGTISEKFRSTRGGHIFYWFKMGDSTIHIWDVEVYRMAKVGEVIILKGYKKMSTHYDRPKIK